MQNGCERIIKLSEPSGSGFCALVQWIVVRWCTCVGVLLTVCPNLSLTDLMKTPGACIRQSSFLFSFHLNLQFLDLLELRGCGGMWSCSCRQSSAGNFIWLTASPSDPPSLCSSVTLHRLSRSLLYSMCLLHRTSTSIVFSFLKELLQHFSKCAVKWCSGAYINTQRLLWRLFSSY